DVVINPIFCGPANHSDARDWQEYAKLCGGRFASIDQEGGAVAIATPMDKELAALSAKINTTYVCYGTVAKEKSANQLQQDANALKLGAPVAAGRAQSKSSAVYNCSDWDLVDRCKHDPKFDVKKLAESELSEEMKKMTPEQR